MPRRNKKVKSDGTAVYAGRKGKQIPAVSGNHIFCFSFAIFLETVFSFNSVFKGYKCISWSF